MAATMAAITPTLTRLIQELQTGFATECQKKLDEQRTVLERRIQMLEAQVVVEKKRRIQAQSLFNALKSQLSPNQARVNDLNLFLSSVAEFADELKSMVHSIYQGPAHNLPSLSADTEQRPVSDLNAESGSSPSEITSSVTEPGPGSVSIQTVSDDDHHEDDFVPARHLPNHPSTTQQQQQQQQQQQPMQIDTEPIAANDGSSTQSSLVPSNDLTSSSTDMQCVSTPPPAAPSSPALDGHGRSRFISVTGSTPASSTPNTATMSSSPAAPASPAPAAAAPASPAPAAAAPASAAPVSAAPAPSAFNPSSHGSNASSTPSPAHLTAMKTDTFDWQTPSPLPSQSITPLTTSVSSGMGQHDQTHSALPAAPLQPIPKPMPPWRLPPRETRTDLPSYSGSTSGRAAVPSQTLQDIGTSPISNAPSPKLVPAVPAKSSPVTRPVPSSPDPSSLPASLEQEIIQLLQTKSSSTCCDVKTVPMMYNTRYERDFGRRLIDVGLSNLETFVNYFRWQSDMGKTSLVFTEKVLDNQSRIFISVMQGKGSKTAGPVKQEDDLNRCRSLSNGADRSSSISPSPLSSPVRSLSRSPERTVSRSRSVSDENINNIQSRSCSPLARSSRRSSVSLHKSPRSHLSRSRSSSRDDYSRRTDDYAKRPDGISGNSTDHRPGFCYYFNKDGCCQRMANCRYTHACRSCHSFSHGYCSCTSSSAERPSSRASDLSFRIRVGNATINRSERC